MDVSAAFHPVSSQHGSRKNTRRAPRRTGQGGRGDYRAGAPLARKSEAPRPSALVAKPPAQARPPGEAHQIIPERRVGLRSTSGAVSAIPVLTLPFPKRRFWAETLREWLQKFRRSRDRYSYHRTAASDSARSALILPRFLQPLADALGGIGARAASCTTQWPCRSPSALPDACRLFHKAAGRAALRECYLFLRGSKNLGSGGGFMPREVKNQRNAQA
jgi:hypothetical protein